MQSKACPGSMPPGRRALERISGPLLERLTSLPGWILPIGMLALLLLGLIVGGIVGFAALTLITIFLAWLAALAWPALRPSQRALRLLVIGVVAAAAAYQLLA